MKGNSEKRRGFQRLFRFFFWSGKDDKVRGRERSQKSDKDEGSKLTTDTLRLKYHLQDQSERLPPPTVPKSGSDLLPCPRTSFLI